MTSPRDPPPKRIYPTEPEVSVAEDCCFRMWGLLIQVQVDGTHGSTKILAERVQEIAANEKCKSHPASCACHVPDHPWIYKDDVDALSPLSFHHNPKCQCAGYQRCASKEMAMAAAAAAVRAKREADAAIAQQMTTVQRTAEEELAANPGLEVAPCRCDAQYANISCSCLAGRIAEAKKAAAPASPLTRGAYDYKHNVDTCACGTCYKARVDSGTEEAYLKRCKEATNASLAKLSTKYNPQSLRRQESYQPDPSTSFGQALATASAAIAKAAAASGGSTGHPDFAKNLFAAMGAPHDSKCPHGLPFYSCMPCSH